jgi:hypothetical protein
MFLEIVLGIISLSLLVGYINLALTLHRTRVYVQTIVTDYIILREELDNVDEDKQVEFEELLHHKEGFIKFLSDSRESAFEYIEESIREIKQVLVMLENPTPELIDGVKLKLSKLVDLDERKNNE